MTRRPIYQYTQIEWAAYVSWTSEQQHVLVFVSLFHFSASAQWRLNCAIFHSFPPQSICSHLIPTPFICGCTHAYTEAHTNRVVPLHKHEQRKKTSNRKQMKNRKYTAFRGSSLSVCVCMWLSFVLQFALFTFWNVIRMTFLQVCLPFSAVSAVSVERYRLLLRARIAASDSAIHYSCQLLLATASMSPSLFMCSCAYAVRLAVFTHVLGVEHKQATARKRQIYAVFICIQCSLSGCLPLISCVWRTWDSNDDGIAKYSKAELSGRPARCNRFLVYPRNLNYLNISRVLQYFFR